MMTPPQNNPEDTVHPDDSQSPTKSSWFNVNIHRGTHSMAKIMSTQYKAFKNSYMGEMYHGEIDNKNSTKKL